MKSNFYLIRSAASSDSESEPQPVPIPIRLVADKISSSASTTDPSGGPPPAANRDDRFYPAWDKFLEREPDRSSKLSSIARGIKQEQDELKIHPDGIRVREGTAVSYEEAAENCKFRVAAIVEECERLNQKYRDAAFDLEATSDCLRTLSGRFVAAINDHGPPPWVKRCSEIYDEPEFFVNGADAADVHQGVGGDCWFLAALMSVSAKPSLISRLCVARNEKAGVYGFVFFRDGEWISEVIDDKLYLKVGDDDELDVVKEWDRDKKLGTSLKFDEDKLKSQLQKGGEALYFSRGEKNETWVPLIEKAYAKAHGDYCAIEGGFASEAAEDLTGGVATVIHCEDIMDKDRFWSEYLLKVNDQYLFGSGGISSDRKGFVGGHAYAILQAYEDKEKGLRLLKMRNPWGEFEWTGEWSDGSKMWTGEMMTKLSHTFGDDGIFWISYGDFLKHFPAINRVRLFDESWSVAGCWTSVSVPWTVDYHDDCFMFSTTHAGPVVIVLQQPDDRYFRGLKGRYYHSLHFRVYKEGRLEKWIVRSLHNSGNWREDTRSVSAEIDHLEPGIYEVLFKITTQRMGEDKTAAEVIRLSAKERREKLLEVGRRYDFAATKGNLRQAEKDLREVERTKKLERRKRDMKGLREHNRKQKEQDRKRKARLQKARETRKNLKKQDVQDEPPIRPSEQETTSVSTDTVAAEPHPEPSPAVEVGMAKEDDSNPSEGNKQVDTPESTDPGADSPQALDAAANDEVSKGEASKEPDATDEASVPVHEQCEDESEEDFSHDDFDWDSEIDAPLSLSSDDEAENQSEGIFGDDRWAAICVVGLRVYAQGQPPKIWTVKAGVS